MQWFSGYFHCALFQRQTNETFFIPSFYEHRLEPCYATITEPLVAVFSINDDDTRQEESEDFATDDEEPNKKCNLPNNRLNCAPL